MQEVKQKLGRIRDLLKKKKLDGILITQQKNFSWLTSGRGFVNQATERAVSTILITNGEARMIVNNIEAARLIEEETQAEFDHVESFPWYEPTQLNELIMKRTSGAHVAWDTDLEADFISLRTTLTEKEEQRIRLLAVDTAEAIEQTAREIQIGETEMKMAARLAANCISKGIEPIVNLVATDQRVFIRRHPLPTFKTLEKYAMLVIGGRRQGQIVSATRSIHFGEPPSNLLSRQQAVATVDAAMIAQTIPGARFTDLFTQMKEAYSIVGYADEWRHHHQGGLSGYVSREQILHIESKTEVKVGQVYAWNPSISGVKSEDTILVSEQGQEILSLTNQYPTIEVEWNGQKWKRPGILVR